jgi:hypothetical protein
LKRSGLQEISTGTSLIGNDHSGTDKDITINTIDSRKETNVMKKGVKLKGLMRFNSKAQHAEFDKSVLCNHCCNKHCRMN